jgi:hypothetical protein
VIDPNNDKSTAPAQAAPSDPDRRAALRLGIFAGAGLLLGGCASAGSRISGDTPGVQWPSDRSHTSNNPQPTIADSRRKWQPPKSWDHPTPAPSLPQGVISRSSWATGAPIPKRMDRMLPPTRITIHHDGMDPVSLRSRSDVAHRLDQIRRSHLTRNFGDIGYHYIIDPNGNVWEGRPMSWQGAHVGRQNEHNIGVMCMGNFEVERPTSAQLDALDRHVAALMRTYRIPVREVKTHRELASTSCPGRNLQPHMNQARRGTLAFVG